MKKKMKKRWEGKQKSWLYHHNMSVSSDSFLLWFPPLHTLIRISDYIRMTHTHISLCDYPCILLQFGAFGWYLTCRVNSETLLLWRSRLDMTHMRHICMQKGEIIRAHSRASPFTHVPIQKMLLVPRRPNNTRSVSLVFVPCQSGLNAVVAVVECPESRHFDLLDPFPFTC